jgi:hypothetical protein
LSVYTNFLTPSLPHFPANLSYAEWLYLAALT